MRKLLVIVPLLGLLATGCASVSAKGKAPDTDRPPLAVPEPPPRIIEPAVELPPEPVDDLPPLPGTPPPVTSPRSARTRETPKPAAEKPADPKPVEQPAPVAEPPPAPPPPPSAQLRTPQTADTSGAARTVRFTIDTAQGVLNSVNVNSLSNERKKAFNDAKKLLEEAEDALKKSDLVRALAVAQKAETLAKELAGKY